MTNKEIYDERRREIMDRDFRELVWDRRNIEEIVELLRVNDYRIRNGLYYTPEEFGEFIKHGLALKLPLPKRV